MVSRHPNIRTLTEGDKRFIRERGDFAFFAALETQRRAADVTVRYEVRTRADDTKKLWRRQRRQQRGT